MNRFTLLALAAPLLLACTQSSNAPAVPSDGGLDDSGDAAVVVPPTAACDGDPTLCLSGTMTLQGFTVSYQAAKVELYRVFPNGNVMPVAQQILAKDTKFAFSHVAAWGHYYLRGVVRIGDPSTSAHPGASVATLRGRFAVPVAAGATFDLVVQPVQLELLETLTGTDRKLGFVSAHVYDPGSGQDLTDATVSFTGAGSPTPMPYVTNASGKKSYFVAFNPGVTASPPFTITTSHASLGAMPLSWDMTPEASVFQGALTSPAEGAMIAANMPLAVTWPLQPAADYTVVELFANQAGSFVTKYTSPAAIASDVTTETIPGANIAPGAYLLNVDLAQAACQLGTAKGCTYLIHAATANLTAQ